MHQHAFGLGVVLDVEELAVDGLPHGLLGPVGTCSLPEAEKCLTSAAAGQIEESFSKKTGGVVNGFFLISRIRSLSWDANSGTEDVSSATANV